MYTNIALCYLEEYWLREYGASPQTTSFRASIKSLSNISTSAAQESQLSFYFRHKIILRWPRFFAKVTGFRTVNIVISSSRAFETAIPVGSKIEKEYNTNEDFNKPLMLGRSWGKYKSAVFPYHNLTNPYALWGSTYILKFRNLVNFSQVSWKFHKSSIFHRNFLSKMLKISQ